MSTWNKLENSPFEVTSGKIEFDTTRLGKYALKKSENKLYLFNNGDVCTAVTGGYTKSYNHYGQTGYDSYYTIGNDISITGGSGTNGADGGIRTISAVDITDYNYLKCHVTSATKSTSYDGAYEFIFGSTVSTIEGDRYPDGKYVSRDTGDIIYDISKLTGNKYLFIWGYAARGNIIYDQMWLEK